MRSILRPALRYEGPNASSVRRTLRLAGVALIPAALWIVELLFWKIGSFLRIEFVSDFVAILGLLIYAFGGIWCIVFAPLLVGTLVLLRRVFKDPEIPWEVSAGTATIVTVAFATMLVVIGVWYSQSNRR